MIKKLWVDDIRFPPTDDWDVVRNYTDAITALKTKKYGVVSLDHDIASFLDDREYTGYDIALWLANRAFHNKSYPKTILVHSQNPVGKANIQSVIKRYL